MRLPALALLPLAFTVPALAVDGVVEINQVCVSAGCHPGDSPGFPVTLGGSGGTSYRLTSNLDTSPDVDTTAITVTADHVTLDLNGFSILGPAICLSSGGCTAGAGAGIAASNDSGLSVRDGTVRGFAAGGIIAADLAQIRRVVALHNGGNAFEVGHWSLVSGSTAYLNGQHGVEAGNDARIDDVLAKANKGDGIRVNLAGRVTDCTADANTGTGIHASWGSNLSGNTSFQNELDGIFADRGSLVQGNTLHSNTQGGSGWALNLGTGTGYRNNVVSQFISPTTGLVTGGVDGGGNVCNSSLTCP